MHVHRGRVSLPHCLWHSLNPCWGLSLPERERERAIRSRKVEGCWQASMSHWHFCFFAEVSIAVCAGEHGVCLFLLVFLCHQLTRIRNSKEAVKTFCNYSHFVKTLWTRSLFSSSKKGAILFSKFWENYVY